MIRMTLMCAAALTLALGACDKKPEAEPVAPAGEGEKSGPGEGAAANKGEGSAEKKKAEPPKGVELAPEGGKFKITFPAGNKPVPNDQSVDTPAGKMAIKVWMAETADSVFIVNYTEMPAKLLAGGNARKYLDGAKTGALGRMNGKLIKEEDFELLGYPGMRMWFSGSSMGQTVYGRTDAVFASPRLYQVQVLGTSKGVAETAASKAFFESFELVGTEKYQAKVYKSEAGGMEIAFPPSYPEPQETTSDEKLPDGGTMKLTMALSTTNKGALGVGFADLPDGGEVGKKNFDDARDGLIGNIGAKLDKEEDVQIAGKPARRVWISGERQGNTYFGRVDIVGGQGRLYMVQALAPSKEQLTDAQVEAYFKSFKMSGGAAAPKAKDGAAPKAKDEAPDTKKGDK